MNIKRMLEWPKKIGFCTYLWRMLYRQAVKRILRKDLKLSLANGYTVTLPSFTPFSSVAWITNGSVDDGAEHMLHALHVGNGIFLDIGAHIGLYSVLMGDKASKVVAFEPDPRTLPTLRQNLEQVPGSEIVECAVGARSSTDQFLLADSLPHSKLKVSGDDQPAGKAVPVNTLCLDEWAERNKSLDCVETVKIDVEGAEEGVIKGAEKMIARSKPIILVETSRSAFRGYVRTIDGAGYRVCFLKEKRTGRPPVVVFAQARDFASSEGDWTGMLLIVPAHIKDTQVLAAAHGCATKTR